MTCKYMEKPIGFYWCQSVPLLHTNQGKGTEIQPNGVTPAGETWWGDMHDSHRRNGRNLEAGMVATG